MFIDKIFDPLQQKIFTLPLQVVKIYQRGNIDIYNINKKTSITCSLSLPLFYHVWEHQQLAQELYIQAFQLYPPIQLSHLSFCKPVE